MPYLPPSPDELRRALDPEGTLPHEDLTSSHLEDALRWASVYGELVALKVALLKRADEVLEGASDDVLEEADIDRRLLRAQLEGHQGRQSFWAQKAKVLEAGGTSGTSESKESP